MKLANTLVKAQFQCWIEHSNGLQAAAQQSVRFILEILGRSQNCCQFQKAENTAENAH